MKLIILSILMAVFACFGISASTDGLPYDKMSLDIVPLPVSAISDSEGCFMIGSDTYFEFNDVSDKEQEYLTRCIERLFGRVRRNNGDKIDNCIELNIVKALEQCPSEEGYKIRVTDRNISIEACSATGLFYALQSLNQLCERNSGRIPLCHITDYPRFQYRGLMIDVSRNFRSKEFVKKQIDAMSRLKLNRLHLHLTDCAGWRIQIDRYPRLTEFAAWRKGETWTQWDGRYCEQDEPQATGGFYTKDDLRDIIDYAAERFITVIPEIEMPGHSGEVLAAYPELSCTGMPYVHHEFCIGNEATFEFVENVLDEVVDIFPSEYINIGGDEASKEVWQMCPRCRKRMKDEDLVSVDELQSYMINRVGTYLKSKGRKLIGWDEIAADGITADAMVLSWRGLEPGIKAAENGHEVVMAPGRFCYFDGYQDAPFTQPRAIGGYLPLSLAYSFDPAPDTLSISAERNIKGVEATLFTEYIANDSHAEYMLYPRVLALAEVAWTPQSMRQYEDFHRRASVVNEQLKSVGYNVFDMDHEVGNRKNALTPVTHLAVGKAVTYNDCSWSSNYPAAKTATLTDGLRGGWNYNDLRWQGFYNDSSEITLDVTIDLEKIIQIGFVGADFMQICGPDVWFPRKIVISVSDDGKEFRTLSEIREEAVEDDQVSFRNFGWIGSASARFIRYQAYNKGHFLFTDEIVVR